MHSAIVSDNMMLTFEIFESLLMNTIYIPIEKGTGIFL